MPLPRAYIKFSICHSLFHIDMKKLCLLAGGEGGGYPMITIMSRSVLPSRCPQHLITVLITAAAWPGQLGYDNNPNILGHAPIFPSQAPLPGSSSRPPAGPHAKYLPTHAATSCCCCRCRWEPDAAPGTFTVCSHT